jgi:hypothetical protein
MAVETCKNCGQTIGELEQAFAYNTNVVCLQCYRKLSGQLADATARSQAPSLSQNILTKPGKLTTIGGMRLGAGICNIIAGIIFCWLIFPIVMIPLGIVEIISASNLLKLQPEPPTGIKTIAILEIIAIITMAGWISVVVGILTLVFLSDERVKNYLSQVLPQPT